ncbi:MAG: hypothetical protein ACOX88_01375 [Christensenellales bacterium]|jgi:hypothetical protein
MAAFTLETLIHLKLEDAEQMLESFGIAFKVFKTTPPRGESRGIWRVVRAIEGKSGAEITAAAFLPAKE